MTKKIIILFILFAAASVLFAQAVPGENLTIKIAVAGQGDELYFWWGHIALVIQDSDTGRGRFYDYGIFSFENDDFFKNFAYGLMLYKCMVSSEDRNIELYKERNRNIVYFTLDLPPEAKLMVRDFVENNVLPENSDYYYHHFKDNCSTRIRDIIDMAVGGQFYEKYGQMPSGFTLRDHVRRHTYHSPFYDWILNFWMGQVIDTPLTVWEDMFLPEEVGKRISEFWYTDSDGQMRKLVPSETDPQIIYTATGRRPVLEFPRKQWPSMLVFSLLLSALFGSFFFMYSKKIPAGKVLTGISMSLCGLVFGVAASLLYFLNIFTNHDYTFENYNMLFASPLLLAAVPLGICYAFSKKPERQFIYDLLLRLLWLLTVIGILITMIIKLFPAFYQQNLPEQMLMLPIALLFAFQPVGLRQIIEKVFRSRKVM